MCGCFACIYVCEPHVCLAYAEARRGYRTPGTKATYSWLLATMWVLGTGLQSSGRTVLLTAEPQLWPSGDCKSLKKENSFTWQLFSS